VEKAEKRLSLRTIDLYAGAGGLALGFKLAGFKVVAAFDNWKPAIDTLRRNFSDTEIVPMNLDTFKGDVTPFTKYKPDVIIGGPPCQDFSHAGKRNEDLGRGKLTVTFAEIVTGVKPKWFVMENVDRILKTRKYLAAKAKFKEYSYGITEKVIDASFCGVPQKRKRYFMIGELHGKDDALLPYIQKSLAEKPMTLKDYFERNGIGLDVKFYYRHPRNYERRAVFSVDEPSPTIRGVNRPIPSTYKKHPRDASEISEKVRPLTTLERSYIQTFPKDYRFAGSKTEQEQLIGNAVPVKLAECVSNCIIEYLRHPPLDACYESTQSDRPTIANSP